MSALFYLAQTLLHLYKTNFMKKLIIALSLMAMACTKKDSPIHTVVIEKHNYKCYIADSIVYNWRTCANSTSFDTANLYYQPLTDLYVNFDSVTPKFMDSVLSSISVETKVCRMAWLFCDNSGTHDQYDTLTIYKKVKILN